MKQQGQVILILILVMTVALSIGLSIVQKSLVDISTASKVEQSSRAFSAAEAGVEKALRSSTDASCTNCQTFTDTSSQIARIQDVGSLPVVPASGSRQAALEFPPLAKEDVSQVWLADYNSTTNPPTAFYTQDSLDVYWGNSLTDKAALELTLIFHNGSAYQSQKWYLDHSSASRNPANGFETVTCAGGNTPVGGITVYQCKKTLSALPVTSPNRLMLLRARLLYNTTSQPLAVGSTVTCPSSPCTSYSLPSQARSIVSTGVSGETERKVKIYQLYNVVPHYFDYAIFSAGDINK